MTPPRGPAVIVFWLSGTGAPAVVVIVGRSDMAVSPVENLEPF